MSDATRAIVGTDRTVTNVEAAFARIGFLGDHLSARAPASLVPKRRYQDHDDNFDGIQNHFQGICRLPDSNYLVVSGGDWKAPRIKRSWSGVGSDLLVVNLASRPEVGPMWSNLAKTGKPGRQDRVVACVHLDTDHWHAGGMDTVGNLLAVPVEYSPPPIPLIPPDKAYRARPEPTVESSLIQFYDMALPEEPVHLIDLEVRRRGAKAGAVALTRLLSGRYLLAVWSDSDQLGRRLDLYLSTSDDLARGWGDLVSWRPEDVRRAGRQDRNFSNFQCLNLVRQADGALYLCGFHNTSSAAPLVGGRDYGDLYTFELRKDADDARSRRVRKVSLPRITKVANKHFECRDDHCNMNAGTTLYVDDNQLLVYGIYHFLSRNRQLRMTEFRPTVGDGSTPSPGDAWVELYEQPGFEGRRLSLRGVTDLEIPNLDKVNAQGKGFEDLARSLRYHLPAGYRLDMFRDKGCSRRVFSEVGDGTLVEVMRLGQGVAGEVSFLRVVAP